jgi:hypothetical protein
MIIFTSRQLRKYHSVSFEYEVHKPWIQKERRTTMNKYYLQSDTCFFGEYVVNYFTKLSNSELNSMLIEKSISINVNKHELQTSSKYSNETWLCGIELEHKATTFFIRVTPMMKYARSASGWTHFTLTECWVLCPLPRRIHFPGNSNARLKVGFEIVTALIIKSSIYSGI